MKFNSPVYPTNETFVKFLASKGINNVITALPDNRLEYQDLYDAYALSNKELGLLIGEYNYFCKELTSLNDFDVKKVYFTHISHFLGRHKDINKILPKNVELAYDNLEIDL